MKAFLQRAFARKKSGWIFTACVMPFVFYALYQHVKATMPLLGYIAMILLSIVFGFFLINSYNIIIGKADERLGKLFGIKPK